MIFISSEEWDIFGNSSDRYIFCFDSFDSKVFSSGKDFLVMNFIVICVFLEKIVDEIFYFVDVSCEVVFIVFFLLLSY